jgi:dTDP-4-dehydrorhamnose reductase
MKILVTGGGGLLAHCLWELSQTRPADVFVFLNHAEFDLTRPDLMAERLAQFQPDAVINTAAYNLVDRCETERDLSWSVNALGPQTLAGLCAGKNARLVHYGTDYVFDGKKRSPYSETDPTNPLNHYAAGKFFGEKAVLHASPHHLVLRTSWVFGPHPTQTKSYVHTVLRAAKSGNHLKATTDQSSVPTYAPDLAQWTLELLGLDTGGLIHAVNDEGASRFEWTQVILEEAVRAGLLASAPAVEPVTTAFFNSTMRRPDYTVMSNQKLASLLGRPIGSWRTGLRKMLAQQSRS